MSTSLSLVPLDREHYDSYRAKFAAANPAVVPDGNVAFTDAPTVKLEDVNTHVPVTLTTGVREVVMFIAANGGSARVEISEPTAGGLSPEMAFLKSVYDRGGVMAGALHKNFFSMIGNAKISGLPSKNSAGSAKKLMQCIDQDLSSKEGQKPAWFPQPVKIRVVEKPGQPDEEWIKYGTTIYFSDVRAGARASPEVPPVIAAAFPSNHVIYKFFEANQVVPKPPPITVANTPGDGKPQCPWKALAAAMRNGCDERKTAVFKAAASLTLGGFGIRFNETRKLFTASAYLNGPGLRIYCVPQIGAKRSFEETADDAAIYDAMRSATTATPDVYADMKRAKVISSSDDES